MDEQIKKLDYIISEIDSEMTQLMFRRASALELKANLPSTPLETSDEIHTFVYKLYLIFANQNAVVDFCNDMQLLEPINKSKKRKINQSVLTQILDRTAIPDINLLKYVRVMYNKKRGYILDWNLQGESGIEAPARDIEFISDIE